MQQAASNAPSEEETPALRKMDASLRFALADKTSSQIGALAELARPLAAGVLEEMQAAGLEVLSASDRRLHVRGDAQALLVLARREEVTRMHVSQAMRPSQEQR